MSSEYSRKVIADIATEREADDYINGLLKDPDMQADMQKAEPDAASWKDAMQELGEEFQQPQSTSDRELER
jgi:hypothetical protein